MIAVKKREEGYVAEVTPPHSRIPWKTASPLPVERLISELESLGCHQIDIGDALYAAEPEWLLRAKVHPSKQGGGLGYVFFGPFWLKRNLTRREKVGWATVVLLIIAGIILNRIY